MQREKTVRDCIKMANIIGREQYLRMRCARMLDFDKSARCDKYFRFNVILFAMTKTAAISTSTIPMKRNEVKY